MMNKDKRLFPAIEIGNSTYIPKNIKGQIDIIYATTLEELLTGIGSEIKPKDFSNYYLAKIDKNNLAGISYTMDPDIAISIMETDYKLVNDISGEIDLNDIGIGLYYNIYLFNRSYYIVREDKE